MQYNIKKIKASTWSRINDILVAYAKNQGIENGKQLRTDTSVTETNIVYPIDARLLRDSVRVLSRIMIRSRENRGVDFVFHNRTRRAKRPCFAIVMLKGKNAEKKRKKLYRKLIKTANEVFDMGVACLHVLEVSNSPEAATLADNLDRFLTHCAVALDQCERRILKNEKVLADDRHG